MREQPGIPEESLRACLQEQYDLYPVTLEFLPLGLDYNAGVYRVVSEQGTPYLLKVTSRPLYEPRCLVPCYLNDQGITAVVAPVPTRSGALWTKLVDWTVFVYPFIDGDSSLTGMTNEQWREVGTIFKRIHQVMLPPFGFESLRKETFDPTEYARWIRTFKAQHLHSRHDGSGSSRALRADWVAHQSTIHTGVTSLEKLAPKERDFIFVREPQATAFWEGYGPTEIDWVALTYYLWERVVQDLIERTQDVCFRDDLGEETRADIAQLFHEILAEEGGTIDAAYAAAAHLAT
jgi:spectinomycin phosphotransferase